jgi:hypothetical protein
MLTKIEQDLRNRLSARTDQGSFYNLTRAECDGIAALIDRLVDPRTVLEEAERLLRDEAERLLRDWDARLATEAKAVKP